MKRSKKIRDKISKATKLAMKNPQIREKMRLAKLGKPGANKGYKFTKDQLKKASDCHKGQKAWNKGLKGCYTQTLETIDKRRKQMMGKDNPSWKDKKLGYGGVHQRLYKHYGIADCCENKNCPKKINHF